MSGGAGIAPLLRGSPTATVTVSSHRPGCNLQSSGGQQPPQTPPPQQLPLFYQLPVKLEQSVEVKPKDVTTELTYM